MADIDARNIFTINAPPQYSFTNPVRWLYTRLDLSHTDFDGAGASDVTQVFDIPAESAVIGGYMVVTTVFAASTNATWKAELETAAGTLSGLISISSLAKGTVINLQPNDKEDDTAATTTVGQVLYVTAADKFVLTSATAAVPATGVIDIHLGYIPILDNA
jgi:hypothetical protein